MLYKVTIKKILIRGVNFLLFLLFVTSFCNVAFCKELLKNELWYKHAEEYIKADAMMIQHAIEKKRDFFEDYNLKYTAESQLFNSPLPALSKLEKLLSSTDTLDRKVALVNIMVRHIYSERLFRIILKRYDPTDEFFIKFYTYQCFNFFDKNKVRQFEDEFIRILSSENNEAIIISAMSTLIRIKQSKFIPFFVEYFKDGTKGLKRAAYIYLKKMGDGYLEKVKKILEKENATEALDFIKEAEFGKSCNGNSKSPQ